MAIKITAQFSDPDSADLALARLRSSGVAVSAAKVTDNASARAGERRELDVVINPFDAGYSSPIDETWNSLAGANMQTYGGFLWSFRTNPLNTLPRSDAAAVGTPLNGVYNHSFDRRNTAQNDTRGGVTLRFEVPRDEAAKAEGIVISCHGSQVRQKTVH